jgi:nucleoid-associated protein YgaU
VQAASRKSSSVVGALVVCLVALGAPWASAQSLGEIARREREKNKLQNPSMHVYTNDDMKRPEILLPEDRARIEAARKQPARENAAAAANLDKPAEIPLGDVARYYRRLRQFKEQQQLVREGVLPGNKVLAAPKMTIPEMIPSLRPHRSLPQTPGRRDPFSRTRREPFVPAEPPAPVAARGMVRVRRGDSLWKLAAQYLGDGMKWRQIAAVNLDLSDPNLIRMGEEIRIPEQAAGVATNQQRVRRGDSLWKLARTHLGSGFAWACIAQANPQISDVNRIYPGQVLNIPAGCGSSSGTSATARASTLN